MGRAEKGEGEVRRPNQFLNSFQNIRRWEKQPSARTASTTRTLHFGSWAHLPSYVALGKSLNLFKPQFPCLQSGGYHEDSTHSFNPHSAPLACQPLWTRWAEILPSWSGPSRRQRQRGNQCNVKYTVCRAEAPIPGGGCGRGMWCAEGSTLCFIPRDSVSICL